MMGWSENVYFARNSNVPRPHGPLTSSHHPQQYYTASNRVRVIPACVYRREHERPFLLTVSTHIIIITNIIIKYNPNGNFKKFSREIHSRTYDTHTHKVSSETFRHYTNRTATIRYNNNNNSTRD